MAQSKKNSKSIAGNKQRKSVLLAFEQLNFALGGDDIERVLWFMYRQTITNEEVSEYQVSEIQETTFVYEQLRDFFKAAYSIPLAA